MESGIMTRARRSRIVVRLAQHELAACEGIAKYANLDVKEWARKALLTEANRAIKYLTEQMAEHEAEVKANEGSETKADNDNGKVHESGDNSNSPALADKKISVDNKQAEDSVGDGLSRGEG
jgi:hypothetical protein